MGRWLGHRAHSFAVCEVGGITEGRDIEASYGDYLQAENLKPLKFEPEIFNSASSAPMTPSTIARSPNIPCMVSGTSWTLIYRERDKITP